MGDYESRRQLLISAGLEAIIPQVNLQGAPFVVVANIIEVLENYGRISFDHEALGQLLNRIKEMIGPGDEIQHFFDYLLLNYRMMLPVKTSDKFPKWKINPDSDDVSEKIIGENTLKHIAFLGRALEVARSVAYIEVLDNWSGTGFMISPDLLITNHHVLPDAELLSSTIFRFNYQTTFSGALELSMDYSAKQNGIFHASADLDYAVVELDLEPGNKWGFISIGDNRTVLKESRVNVIQHPAGMPKQISLQNNFVAYADQKIIQYYTSTLGGSSGAPVMNDQWQVVALHHAGGMIYEPGSGYKYFRNEGIAITAIFNDLPEIIKSRLRG